MINIDMPWNFITSNQTAPNKQPKNQYDWETL